MLSKRAFVLRRRVNVLSTTIAIERGCSSYEFAVAATKLYDRFLRGHTANGNVFENGRVLGLL